MKMHVERYGKRLALELPEEWVDRYGLRDGDEIEGAVVEAALEARLQALEEQRRQAIERMRERARPLPPDYKFDREEANWRPAMDRW